MYNRSQKLLAEFAGTFVVVFFAAGSICADQFLRSSNQPGLGMLGMALAYGLAAGVMVTSVGHISGGHLNPAVTIGHWVTRRISSFDALTYWAAQIGGGMAAAYVLRRLPFDVWTAAQMGTPDLANGITRTNGMLFECVMTFFLVFVFFASMVDQRGHSNHIAGFAVGLTITVAVLFGGPFTGAAMNPARVLGPALMASHWTNHGVYWIGPLAGGVAAGWLYDTLFIAKT